MNRTTAITADAGAVGALDLPDHRLFRWSQLVIGIVCMALIANLQYGWTLFVSPIDQKYHWGRAAIQLSFSIFVLVETWLVPIEGFLVDRFGPRPVVAFGGILAGIGWVLYSSAGTLTQLYVAAVLSGLGAGCVYGTCVGNALRRPFFGFVSDMIGRENTMFIAFGAAALMLLTLATCGRDPLVFVLATATCFAVFGEIYSLSPRPAATPSARSSPPRGHALHGEGHHLRHRAAGERGRRSPSKRGW